ncbi:MAG: DoxX family protein [Gemmatimonadaceae bacterium]
MALSGPAPRTDAGLLVLRLGVGVLLLFHGFYKVTHGVAWIAGPLGKAGLPAWLAYGTYVGEVLAPVLVILGLWTRLAALVIAFDLFMAIFLARQGDIAKISPMSGGWAIELELLFIVAALAIALAGGGRYGVGKS